jgi:lysophospholipase L1-like esterase
VTRPRAGNALLLLGGIVVSLAVAEASLRALAPRGASLYVADDALFYRLRPGAAQTLEPPLHQRGASIAFRVNAAGFRGPELAATPPPRVIVYGDSFVESRFTHEEASFAVRLARELGAGGASAEVVNAGVTGYGPDQALLRMERDLPALRPALVVAALFVGNDWGDLVRNQLVALDAQGRLERRSPVLDASQRGLIAPPETAWATLRALRRLGRGLVADPVPPVPQARTLAWALGECRGEYAARGSGRVTNLFLDHYDADVALQPDSEAARYKRALMGGVLAAMREEAARAGVPLLLLAIPDFRDLCTDCAHRDEARSYPDYRPSALTDGLDEIARAEGIPILDLFGPFQGRAAELYHTRDGHWNEAGQALAARLTAERIAETGWLR